MRFFRNGTWINIVRHKNSDRKEPIILSMYEPTIKEAQIAMENMKTRIPDQDTRFHIDGRNRFRLVSEFGRDEIFINTIYREEYVEHIKIIEEEVYRFVPAIAIRDFAGEDVKIGLYSNADFEVGDMSVCASPKWTARIAEVRDTPICYNPGDKLDDLYGYTDDMNIIGLTNWANRDWWFWEDAEELEDTNTDTGWDPLPYKGYSNYDASYDYLIDFLRGFGELMFFAMSVPNCNPEIYAAIVAQSWPSVQNPPYTWTGNILGLDDGKCEEWDSEGWCCNLFVHDTIFWTATRCGSSHFYADYAAMKNVCETVLDYRAPTYPFTCYYYPIQTRTLEMIHSGSYGNDQDRLITDRLIESSIWESRPDPLPGRSAGKVVFPPGTFIRSTEFINRFTTSGPCQSSQTTSYAFDGHYPEECGYMGGYVQDDCKISKLKDLYFVMYGEYVYKNNSSAECSPMRVSGVGYNASGVYQDGGWTPCPSSPTIEEYYVLWANINGECVEIDRGETGNEYFYVTDSLIFDFYGTPIYMYAYAKYDISGALSEPLYTKYGYFYDDHRNHYRSDAFEPVGIERVYGGLSPLHDVFGSVHNNKHGYGQCGGFIIHEKKKKEINT